MYINRSLKEYLNDLAAKRPAPGGGSAAALAASVGASLMSMVANYTVGNPKYKEVEGKVASILVRVENHRAQLQGLVDRDVDAYNRLSTGIKEFSKNPSRLDEIYKEAITPPLEVCKITSECLKLCKDLAEYGNKNLITDTAIAAIMLEGAFLSAKFNVYINLKYIKDMDYIEKVHKALAPLEDEMPKLKEDILEKCEDVIAK